MEKRAVFWFSALNGAWLGFEVLQEFTEVHPLDTGPADFLLFFHSNIFICFICQKF